MSSVRPGARVARPTRTQAHPLQSIGEPWIIAQAVPLRRDGEIQTELAETKDVAAVHDDFGES